MKKLTALCAALLISPLLAKTPNWLAMAADASPGPAAFSTHTPDLLVKIKKKRNNKNNTDGEAQPEAAPNTGSGNKCEGEHSCPDGMVVLDKPNKYGACCEAKEGLCPKGLLGTPPDCTCPEGTIPSGHQENPCMAKMNCPFPGQVGNPPDCTCPKETEFVGYKGCVKVRVDQSCDMVTVGEINDFTQKCYNKRGETYRPEGPEGQYYNPTGPHSEPRTLYCCKIKYYEK
jgi:hypothetical protein